MSREVEAAAGRLSQFAESPAHRELLSDLDARRKPRPARNPKKKPRAAKPPRGDPDLGGGPECRRPRRGDEIHGQRPDRPIPNARSRRVDRAYARIPDGRAGDEKRGCDAHHSGNGGCRGRWVVTGASRDSGDQEQNRRQRCRGDQGR
jgi:hypothetical protein